MSINKPKAKDTFSVNHEINVTPFIDIMLVLLIVFMVAAPLATVDVKVDLPVSNAKPAPQSDAPVFLTIQADGDVLLNETPVTEGEFGTELKMITQSDLETRIFLRADKSITYGALMEVMNQLRAEGYLHIALVGIEGAAKLKQAGPQE